VATCTAHTIRRTFALNCLRNGMNAYVLARLMGHADITSLP
jgi:site-specific recombinase XerD